MKKILFIAALLAVTFVNKSFAQENKVQSQLSQLLTSYYGIKDALVAGNINTASTSAEQFVKTLQGIDEITVSKDKQNALLSDAGHISETKDIKHQREHFTSLSNNMVALAKSLKLTTEPIYQAYCPMKKANWLSRDKAIKNPYYGSSMLTCGKVVETIN